MCQETGSLVLHIQGNSFEMVNGTPQKESSEFQVKWFSFPAIKYGMKHDNNSGLKTDRIIRGLTERECDEVQKSTDSMHS